MEINAGFLFLIHAVMALSRLDGQRVPCRDLGSAATLPEVIETERRPQHCQATPSRMDLHRIIDEWMFRLTMFDQHCLKDQRAVAPYG